MSGDEWSEPCPGSGLVLDEGKAPVRAVCVECSIEVETAAVEPAGRIARVRLVEHERMIRCSGSRGCRARWHGGACPVDLSDRRPIITVEVQPRPPVPSYATPYWWGNHTLTFRDEDGTPIWEADVPHAEYGSAKVEKRRGFGWVIVVVLRDDKADGLLNVLALDRVVEGSSTSSWGYWPTESRSADPLATNDEELDP